MKEKDKNTNSDISGLQNYEWFQFFKVFFLFPTFSIMGIITFVARKS